MEEGTSFFPMCLPFSLCLFSGMLLTANETPKMGIYYIPVSNTKSSYGKNRISKDRLFLNWSYWRPLGLHVVVQIKPSGLTCSFTLFPGTSKITLHRAFRGNRFLVCRDRHSEVVFILQIYIQFLFPSILEP